ncbi:arginyltransferase [Photobacterium sp. 1_MG-2023]|uniref:arginyltransferase n=1 Tax=Photobacterium sp. 1_MG-2023 TaxID=3062646 RepID=UPI0026E489CA|nr:arginyltransferase [Photobacterium sp. 1_MG-2023]MDO6705785.1 arginyltransferase [Photobacterium sp. 1_MG-2023]
MSLPSIRLGFTPVINCSYLPEQQEQLGVVIDHRWLTVSGYSALLGSGFRRSGQAIYKPMCEHCKACTPLRIDCEHFTPSKTQKRQQKQLAGFRAEFKPTLDEDWFPLYEQYIRQRHAHGAMYPANRQQFFEFSQANWMETYFLHLYEDDRLIAIAVTDFLDQALSAVYTFFDPNHSLSLGTLCVLKQIDYCRETGRRWLYPGYQIDDCPAMNYKTRYKPYQKLVQGKWQSMICP